jgi:hypothetical protein
MAKPPTEIYIFGKDKVNLVQFVLFNCELSSSDNVDSIQLSRAFRNIDNTFRLEPTVAKASVSHRTRSVHLNDIFLSPNFGLLVRFQDEPGTFALDEQAQSHDLVTVINRDGEELSVTSFAQVSKIK